MSLENFGRNPGASVDDIRKATDALGTDLPEDYKLFLQGSNGGEGMIGEIYAALWGVEELAGLNVDYEVAEYAPGLLLIGSNGGGEAFAFDTRVTPWPVVKVPFVGMDLEYALDMGTSFTAFIEGSENE